MALYLHADQPAVRLMQSKNNVSSFQAIVQWITVSIVNYQMRYGERAFFAMQQLQLTALIYMRETVD